MTVSSSSLTPAERAWITWPLVGAMVVLLLATLTSSVLGDPDTLWHIAAGRWMVEHRQLPVRDMFSWSVPGTPWTAHEWLSELVFYGTYAVAGFRGVVFLVSVAFALLSALLIRFCFDRMEPVHALPAVLVFLAVINTHFLARPHVLVWPLLGFWTAQLVIAADARRAPPWWLLGLLLLWANLHASFTLGLGLAGGLALEALAAEDTTAGRWRAMREWGLFGLGCLLAVAINPNGLGTLLHAVQMMRMKEMLALINEWKSADFHEFQMVLLWIVMVVGLALLGRLRLSPVRVLLLLGLFYMALKHGRYHSTLALTSAFLLAAPMGEGLRSWRPPGPIEDAAGLDAVMARLSAPTRRVAWAAAALLGGAWFALARPLIPSAPSEAIAPARAIAAVHRAGITGPVVNAYGFGGYLIFRGIPVFIDGRADMYGDPFLHRTAEAMSLREAGGLERLLDKYPARWTLLGAKSPAVVLLDHLPNWQRLYADTVAVVHVRRDPRPDASRDLSRDALQDAPRENTGRRELPGR